MSEINRSKMPRKLANLIQMKPFRLILLGAFVLSSFAELPIAQAKEEGAMISNGQGISSPSFWQGLSSQNPAGTIFNQHIKIQGGLAAFEGRTDSLSDTRGSGGLFIGNGLLAAGFEITQYRSVPYGNSNRVNWGFAGRIPSAGFTIGISGHHDAPGESKSFDVGTLIEIGGRSRLGIMVPDVEQYTKSINQFDAAGRNRTFALGLTLKIANSLDFVVDGSYGIDRKDGRVKPGLTYYGQWFVVSGSYGFDAIGNGGPLLSKEFSGGIGLMLSRNILVQYQYKVLPEHLLGLTLRLN